MADYYKLFEGAAGYKKLKDRLIYHFGNKGKVFGVWIALAASEKDYMVITEVSRISSAFNRRRQVRKFDSIIDAMERYMNWEYMTDSRNASGSLPILG